MILVLHPFFLVSLLVNIVLTCWSGNILPSVFSILHLFVLRYFDKHDIYVCVTSLCVHSFRYSRGYLPVPHRNHKRTPGVWYVIWWYLDSTNEDKVLWIPVSESFFLPTKSTLLQMPASIFRLN